jgi:hypothetical protein
MTGKKKLLVLVASICALLVLMFLIKRQPSLAYPGQTTQLPKADFLKIHLLSSEHVAPGTNTFCIGLEDWYVPIVKTEVLEDSLAEEIAMLWRKIPFGEDYSAKCHNPRYALVFYSDASPSLAASVCWECNNFYFSIVGEKPAFSGFDGQSKEAQSLLKKLQTILPLDTK